MMKRMESMVVVLGLTLWGGSDVKGVVRYVDIDATGSNNGSSWCDAYTNLSFALFIASFAGDELRVAQGTYKPTTGTDRTLTFTMYDDVEAYGGYAGCGAIDPDARDISAFVTIMSGEINTASVTDNSYHVVTASGVANTAILDGFTITKGYADGSGGNSNGAGIYNVSGDPVIRNCTITDNFAATDAGGMFNDDSLAVIENCTFSLNVGDFGGAMICLNDSNITITDCVFDRNEASVTGGAIDLLQSSPVISGSACRFEGNETPGAGGAIAFKGGSGDVMISDCEFIDNIAGSVGGAIAASTDFGFFEIFLDDCVFTRNSARDGGAVYMNNPNAKITLCEFVDNEATPAKGSGFGGALWIDIQGSLIDIEINNCLIVGNTAKDDGGGVYFFPTTANGPDPVLANCTIADNTALNGNGGGVFHRRTDPIVQNCVL